jgi:hypothetical protein
MATAMLVKFDVLPELLPKLGVALPVNVPVSIVAESQSQDPSRPSQFHMLPSAV